MSRVGEWSDVHCGMWTMAAWELDGQVMLMQRAKGKDTGRSLVQGLRAKGRVLGHYRNHVT